MTTSTTIKLGSLFDGSGTAPLCAAILDWEPVWASEIEPFPVKVTSTRFPRMKHLGDITRIKGGEIEPVDVIVGGSPCQDLSVAGKQAGLQGGTRSHLFYEMTRIIKEMRRATNGQYPRYIVWENVPGAFSSNKGHDFHEVLKAFCSCADHPCDVPEPPRRGGRAGADKLVWGNAGLIMGDDFSLAWRVLDAQFWGVPQRRRRIFLAVDLGGERAREILFEREGLWRDPQQSGEARESAAAAAVGGADRGVGIRCLNEGDSQTIRQYDVDGIFLALAANTNGGQNRQGVCYAIEGNTVDRNSAQNGRGYCENISPTLDAQDRHAVAAFMGGQGAKAGGIGYSEDVAPTIKSVMSGGNTIPDVVYPQIARTLTAEHDASPCVDRGQNITAYTADCRNGVLNADVSGVLQANPTSLNAINPVVYPWVGITSKENGSNPQPGDPCCTLGTDSRNYLVASAPDIVYAETGAGWIDESKTCETLRAASGGKTANVCVFPEVSGPLMANSHPGSYTGQDAFSDMLPVTTGTPPRKYIVRRLTPLECSRLQGFPDWWVYGCEAKPVSGWWADNDIWRRVIDPHGEVPGSDSAIYKMWGNGMALPCMLYVLSGVEEGENADV